MWAILLSIVAGALGTYYYFVRYMNYFKKCGVPHISPMPFFGNMAQAIFRQKPLAYVVQGIYNFNRDARYVGFYDTMTPVVVIRDPELIKSIAVKNFEHFPNHRAFLDEKLDPLFAKNLFALADERWRDVRVLLTPAFTTSKMKNMFQLMFDYAEGFGEFLSQLSPEKRTMEIKDTFTRYTNDVIATCAFGITIDSIRNPDNDFYLMGKEATVFDSIRTLKFFLVRSVPKLGSWLRIKLVSDRVTKFFSNVIATTIRTRDEKSITRPDMIQLMMDTRGKRGSGKELSLEDMTSQAFTFFFGGFDSTSLLMSFAAHEIAVNPEVQEKLQNEIDSVLEEKNDKVTYEDVNGMEYLDATLNEALRMYPIAVLVDRVCSKDFELPPALPGGKPFVVKKNMGVWFPVYGLHHDPDYFENPSKFDPERFLGENKKNLHNVAYMPFGIGPRICIGNRFALLETKVLIFHLLARCNLRPCAKTIIPLQLSRKGISMSSENGFWLEIVPRVNSRVPVSKGTTLPDRQDE